MRVIIAENLGKKYLINPVKKDFQNRSLKDAIMNLSVRSFYWMFIKTWRRIKKIPIPKKKLETWALKHTSFSVKKGEVLGVIGSNGSGKSTLLRILAGITKPSQGRAILNGQLTALLGIGVGFHMDLSGRENIFLSGAILGIKKKDLEEELNNIIQFSGIRKFIDTPVKYYSTGMFVRLAFSIATSRCIKPDIFLIDEVLSVGDAAFKQKCYQRISKLVKENNTTIIIVSHELEIIEKLSTTCLWLENGSIKRLGPSKKVIGEYLAFSKKKSQLN